MNRSAAITLRRYAALGAFCLAGCGVHSGTVASQLATDSARTQPVGVLHAEQSSPARVAALGPPTIVPCQATEPAPPPQMFEYQPELSVDDLVGQVLVRNPSLA